MHRLARGECGRLPPTAAPEGGPVAVRHDLPVPVATLEPLHFVIHALCRDLSEALEAVGLGVLGLGLDLLLEEGGPRSLEIRTGRPVRDPDLLARLLRRRLENVRLEAAVVGVALTAAEAAPWSGLQAGVLDPVAASEPLPALLARLAEALGPRALMRAVARDTWRPEAAWAPVPLAGEGAAPFPGPPGDQRARPAPLKEGAPDEDPVWFHEAWRLDLPAPRPALLFAEPRPVDMEPAQGPPRRIRIEGRWREVAAAVSEERLAGEWWADPLDRACWVLDLSDGRRVWACRAWGHALLLGAFDQGPG